MDLLLRLWALNMFVIVRGIETIKILEGVAAPFMLTIGLLLFWWITSLTESWASFAPSNCTPPQVMRFFIPSLTGMVGFWLRVALEYPTFTRYARSQRSQMLGQALGLPAAMTLSIPHRRRGVTSASVVIFHRSDRLRVQLLGRFNRPVVAFIALVALLVATLNTNVAADVLSLRMTFRT